MAESAAFHDKNFDIDHHIGEPDVAFYDVRNDPFTLYGFYHPKTEPTFKRLPDAVRNAVSPDVAGLSLHCSGGRVRFSTDSRYVAIKSVMPYIYRAPHMPLTGAAGFDLYEDSPAGASWFCGNFKPDYDMKDGYESKICFPDRKLRYFTIDFPSYSAVSALYIGLQKDAVVGAGMPYRKEKPIVFYGSSITQGACSSRPGLYYQNRIAHRMNLDYLSLGFSGNAKGEDAICAYMAELPMSVFVSDYDHNAPDAEYLAKTHEKLYRTVRAKNPDLPYIMMSRPDFYYNSDCIHRRNVVYHTFYQAYSEGDRNVYYLDGQMLFEGPDADSCTVDGCHPNDLGFKYMAEAVESTLRRIFMQTH